MMPKPHVLNVKDRELADLKQELEMLRDENEALWNGKKMKELKEELAALKAFHDELNNIAFGEWDWEHERVRAVGLRAIKFLDGDA